VTVGSRGKDSRWLTGCLSRWTIRRIRFMLMTGAQSAMMAAISQERMCFSMVMLRKFLYGVLVLLLVLQVACGNLAPEGTKQSSTAPASTGTTRPTPTMTTAPSQPGNGLDDRLSGSWTNEPTRVSVLVDQLGQPVGSVPVGDWYFFDGKGRYVRVARFITFAVGGIHVEEGRYQTENGTVLLFDRMESFFPDSGSPQKARYREATTEMVLIHYRPAVENSIDVLYMKSGTDGAEVPFRRCVEK